MTEARLLSRVRRVEEGGHGRGGAHGLLEVRNVAAVVHLLDVQGGTVMEGVWEERRGEHCRVKGTNMKGLGEGARFSAAVAALLQLPPLL